MGHVIVAEFRTGKLTANATCTGHGIEPTIFDHSGDRAGRRWNDRLDGSLVPFFVNLPNARMLHLEASKAKTARSRPGERGWPVLRTDLAERFS